MRTKLRKSTVSLRICCKIAFRMLCATRERGEGGGNGGRERLGGLSYTPISREFRTELISRVLHSREFYSPYIRCRRRHQIPHSLTPPWLLRWLLRCKHKTRVTEEERRTQAIFRRVHTCLTKLPRSLAFFPKAGTQGMRNTLDNVRHAFQRLHLHSRMARAIIFSRTSTLCSLRECARGPNVSPFTQMRRRERVSILFIPEKKSACERESA